MNSLGEDAGSGGISYDLAAWGLPVYRHDRIEDLLLDDYIPSGIHAVGSPDGVVIDYLFQGFDRPFSTAMKRSVLVAFTAAVPARTGKKAPFFSGMNLGRGLGLPVIAVADPTLALDADLPLGWYAGNQGARGLPYCIARTLDAIAARFDLRLILVGGSNGGFAALAQATLLQADCCAVVWNPQTSISRHIWWRAIGWYAKAAFPGSLEYIRRLPDISMGQVRSFFSQWFDSEGLLHNVCERPLMGRASVLYLQNEYDEHLKEHAAPYINGTAWRRLGLTTFLRLDGKVGIYFGRWGDGHVMPPRAVIDHALKLAASGQVPEVCMAKLELLDDCDRAGRFDWVGVDGVSRDRISIRLDDDEIIVKCNYSDELIKGNELRFAFYLLIDGVRAAVVWYSEDPVARFSLPSSGKCLEVVVFVNDRLGVIASCRLMVD